MSATTTERPLFDFTAPDGVRHTIWTVPAADHDALVAGFAALPSLYIADGHHRAASAARARQALAGRGPGEHDRVLAVAFPDNQMQILPYNRVVSDLSGMTPAQFVERLAQQMTVTASRRRRRAQKGHAAMYLDGEWYALDWSGAARAKSGIAALDVSMLQDIVLEPLLGIADVRTDKRIDFVGGIRGAAELERLVDSGALAVAFSSIPSPSAI